MYGSAQPQGAANPFDEGYEYEGNPFEEIPEVSSVQHSQQQAAQSRMHDPQMAQIAALEDDDAPFDFEAQQQPVVHTQHATSASAFDPQTSGDFGTQGSDPLPEPEVEEPEEDPSNYHIWNIAYYSKYFNVDTSEVAIRITRSLIPFSPHFFSSVETNPDLYGPFWIATTLIFVMAATSNFAKWWVDRDDFSYDFRDVTFGAAAIYGYIAFLPVALWLVCKYLKVKLGLVQIWCIYGYSLFVFIPVSILCILSFWWLRWLLIAVGTGMSLLFLIMNFFPPLLRNNLSESKKVLGGIVIVSIIGLFHIGLALTFKFYFFNYST
eukprot:TRINITY_DN5461_c0_g2_i1.p1 TRINITY_DN5461_c0_g2~~TRINITY_DN5461_c0_g2_i1.p1  ORF type:complete len:322 (-),score=58.58 TRINITY_DN5461_c0_g2_i1:187-1152(-)